MQTCIICGPDKTCKGHPQKRERKPPPEKCHVPAGECAACVCISKAAHISGDRHLLMSPREIQDALKVGPVFCHAAQTNKRKVDWSLTLPVRNAGIKDGAFCIELLEGWFYRNEIGEVWMDGAGAARKAA
jgi:hypothetical protein